MGALVSLTKQQIKVYALAAKLSENKSQLENARLEIAKKDKGIYEAVLIATDGLKIIRREVDIETGVKECSFSISQTVLKAADKVMSGNDRAFVHENKIVVRLDPTGGNMIVDESCPIKADIPFSIQVDMNFPETRPFVEQHVKATVPPKSIIVDVAQLIKVLQQFKQNDASLPNHVALHIAGENDFLLMSDPANGYEDKEIKAALAPIKQ